MEKVTEQTAKVSVIIPVYNARPFIMDMERCLRNQTMADFEVIFVDDCSNDGSAELLQQMIVEDDRFRYIRNEIRKGAAISRNIGIGESKAPYVMCLDADDFYTDDLLEQVVLAAYECDADMVMLERADFKGNIEESRRHHVYLDECEAYDREVFCLEDLPIDFLLRCENGTCDRLVKRELLEKYQIRFQDLRNSNDVFYTVFATFAAKRIVHTKTMDNLYLRRVHSNPGRISNDRDPMCALEALAKIHDKLIQYHMWDKYCLHFWVFALDNMEKQLFVCKNKDRQREVYEYFQSEGLKLLGINPDIKHDKGSDSYFDINYERLPVAYRRQWERFTKEPYEKKCFLNAMSSEAIYEINANRISEIFQYAGKHDLQVGFWGAGRTTAGFLSVVRKIGGTVFCIIDNDTTKCGQAIDGVEVTGFESVYDRIGIVIIPSKLYYIPVFQQIKQKRKEILVLCLPEYLGCECKVEAVIK